LILIGDTRQYVMKNGEHVKSIVDIGIHCDEILIDTYI
jgi:hypothetical protein